MTTGRMHRNYKIIKTMVKLQVIMLTLLSFVNLFLLLVRVESQHICDGVVKVIDILILPESE